MCIYLSIYTYIYRIKRFICSFLQGLEEAELVENLFDCIASALAYPPNQTRFLKAEGIELMILSIKVFICGY